MDALEHAFGLPDGALADAREVLRDYGNMSAATVMFVLERMLAETPQWQRALMTALGPGFTAGFAGARKSVTPLYWTLGLVALERLAELAWAARNTRAAAAPRRDRN